jgi:DNA-binding response OmpR family regulator
MMAAEQKQGVNILLADDESFMREITMNALSVGGYREVRSVFRLSHLREVMGSANPDLLIINGEMSDGDAVEFVRQVRLFRIGRNPFIPVIMTSWHSEGAFVRRVVDGGVDVLVTKPFAAGQLFARIDFLVNGRPPFVATSTYIGPDRRKAKREGDFPQFEVPNTLRERIEGKAFDPEDAGARIAKAFTRIKRHRKRMQENDIGRLFAALSQATREDGASEERHDIVEALKETTRLYLAEMRSSGKAKRLANAFTALLKRVTSMNGGCSSDDCNHMAKLIAEMGIAVPSGSGAVFPGDTSDIFIQAGPAI